MSLENEDQRSPSKGSEKPEIFYTREFLLSLSNLDICKKLPSGFDESVLSEFEDALISSLDRPRNPGNLSLHGFRRNDYSSSPPTRGDSGNYSRGNYGKWESRSSGRSDRDSDSQSDRDSDSGRRYGHQSRRSWQTPEHDGLLGSGSFPRPSGYASGIPAPKVRTNEHHQLGKSNEPYHPPRPYKAVPHSRRDTDAFNDETFGSMECNSEDRAEEERRRRASFEMIRKEQQKALQEKQKHKAGVFSDFTEILDDSKEEKGPSIGNDESEVSAAIPILSNNLEKSSFASQSPASRPLVPPGFKNNTLEKSSGLKSTNNSSLSEVGKSVTGKNLLESEANLVLNCNNDGLGRRLSQEISLVDEQPAGKMQNTPLLNKKENMTVDVSLDGPAKKLGMEGQLLLVAGHFDSHGTLDDPEFAALNSDVLQEKNDSDSTRSYSTSILDKIFGSTLSVTDGSCSAEHHNSKPDAAWSPSSAESSRFAQWFPEEEAMVAADISPAKPNDLLSLIVSGDKGKQQVSVADSSEHFMHDFSSKTFTQSNNKIKLDIPSAANGVSDQVSIKSKGEATPVLTCEDLEQSILSEYSSKTTNTQPPSQNSSSTGANDDQPTAHVNNHASFHLLSMLQKVADQSNTTMHSGAGMKLEDRLVSRGHDTTTVVKEPIGEEKSKNLPDLGNTLTLETLFGSAFMQELQSVKAPVSVQRASIGSDLGDGPETRGLPFPASDMNISSPRKDKSGFQKPNHDFGVSSNQSSMHFTQAVPNREGALEFQLPEEENLISVGETRNSRMLSSAPAGNPITDAKFSSSTPINIMEKLSAFGADIKEEHMELDIPFRNLQVQQSPPRFPPPHMAQVRPLHHHLGSHPAHMSPQMKFMGSDPTFHQDSPANHQFSSSMIRPPFNHPNVRVAGFDAPAHHPMLHQLQMSGNHPLPHMLPDFSRAGPGSHHSHQATGLIQEMNQMHGFPLDPRQANIARSGVPLPGLSNSSGGNPPEAFQRLIEMELRANSKPIPPLAPAHNNQGMYGHEVDLGFRYR